MCPDSTTAKPSCATTTVPSLWSSLVRTVLPSIGSTSGFRWRSLPYPTGGRGDPMRGFVVEGAARVAGRMSDSPPTTADTRRLARDARDRVRFEEEALELSDQVYRVARRLVGSREEAEDLVQETYARAFRSWKSYTPGTNLRAWLLRILTNLNIDRGRRKQRAPEMQPLEDGDYFLYNKLEEAGRDGNTDEE